MARETVKTEQKTESAGHLDYKEQKRLEAENVKRLIALQRLRTKYQVRNRRLRNFLKNLKIPILQTDYVKAGEITDKITGLQDEIESLMEEWERLQMIIEESGYDV